MSLFNRAGAPQQRQPERRDGNYFISPYQLIPLRPPYATAGVPVNSTTAQQKVALLSGVNIVANMPELLPIRVHRGHGAQRVNAPIPQVCLDPEGEGHGIGDFGYKFLSCMMLRGNAFVKVRAVDGQGRPSVVQLLNPDEVNWRMVDGQLQFIVNGKALPRYTPGQAQTVIHRRAFPQPWSPLGLSIVANHARTLGLSLAAEQYGADFFADGGHPSGLITTEAKVDNTAARIVKDRFLAAVRGSREPVVLGNGVKYTPISVAPAESQFLDAQKFTSAEICRMIGPGIAELLGYETGGAMTYQNVQSRSLHVLIYAVDPWLVRLERFMSDFLAPQASEVKFDRNKMLRMTPNDRAEVNRLDLLMAKNTVNEIRADDDLPPVEWGDQPFLPAFGPAAAAAQIKGEFGDLKLQPDPGAGNDDNYEPSEGNSNEPIHRDNVRDFLAAAHRRSKE